MKITAMYGVSYDTHFPLGKNWDRDREHAYYKAIPGDHVKIGYTTINLPEDFPLIGSTYGEVDNWEAKLFRHRISGLQTGSSIPLRYSFSFVGQRRDDGRLLEAWAHEYLASHRMKGEWFSDAASWIGEFIEFVQGHGYVSPWRFLQRKKILQENPDIVWRLYELRASIGR